MNRICLVGRLTNDPELKTIGASGTQVCNFGLAVNRVFKKEGEAEADFFNVAVFGKAGELAGTYLRKGGRAGVEGRLQRRDYTANDGTTRTVLEVRADTVTFVDTKAEADARADGQPAAKPRPKQATLPVDDGDNPFEDD